MTGPPIPSISDPATRGCSRCPKVDEKMKVAKWKVDRQKERPPMVYQGGFSARRVYE